MRTQVAGSGRERPPGAGAGGDVAVGMGDGLVEGVGMGAGVGLSKKQDIKPSEPKTTVKLGKRKAQIPLKKKRREALGNLMQVLKQLSGKDIYIGTYGPSGNHFWLEGLKLTGR